MSAACLRGFGWRIGCDSVKSWQFNRTPDARVSERTRIARELHDTLRQSVHGLLLRFQTALYCRQIARAQAKEALAGQETRRDCQRGKSYSHG